MNNNAKNALETAEELKKNLDKLLKIQRQSINSLPEAERAKLQFVNSEINQIMKAAKEGDYNKLQEISKKYASSINSI